MFLRIQQKSKALKDQLVAWRHQLHQHPEIGMKLPFAQGIVISKLKKMGLDPVQIDRKGVIVNFEGGKSLPAQGSRVIAMRVDMDALPVYEETGVAYSSKVKGYMHACGHDAHTTIGLGVAKVLSEMENFWSGQVKIIFQPGEECLEGAKLMISRGALEAPNVDIILGLHLDPQLPLESVGLRSGQLNAYADQFCVEIRGKSGHGAYPHLAKDPVVAAATLVQALQTVVSRDLKPTDAGVISIGQIRGGTAPNIIPEKVVLNGTIRSLNSNTRRDIFDRMKSIVDGLKKAFGVDCSLLFGEGSPPVICEKKITEFVRQALTEVLGNDLVVILSEPSMGSEDFAFFTQRIPSTMLKLGCRSEEKGYIYPLHSSQFNFDEEILVYGVTIFSYLIFLILERANRI